VWVYQKSKKPQERGTTVQGFENGYFAFIRPDGKADESLEPRLAELEARCGDTLVLAKSILFDLASLSRRNTLALYVSMLFCRATQRRKYSAKIWMGIQKQFVDLIDDDAYIASVCRHYGKKLKTKVSPKRIRERLRRLSVVMQSPLGIRNKFVTDLITSAEIIKTKLLQKPWQIWRAPEGVEFVTSDNPLVTFIPLGNGELNPGHGLNKKDVIVAFPLAPCACLAMGAIGPESITLTEDRVGKINEAVIRLCDRYVYSKTFSEEIEDLVSSYAGSVRYGENAFLPLGLKVPTAKDFLRETLGFDC
jgi:hypothetical protein